MHFFLTRQAVLKWLERPYVYHVARDELFELDNESFRFLRECAGDEGCAARDSAFVEYCMDEGLLTTERVASARPPLERSPQPSLRYLELQITNSCNLRCRHCYLGESGSSHLPFLQVRAALTELERMQGLRVLITGGEPLLHPEFEQINELLPDLSFRKVLFTNGLLLKNGMLKRLKVNEIQVSLDGMERGHDAVRGSGMHERAMNAVRRSLDAGFEVAVSTMVHAANLGEFDEMDRLFRSLGVREWTVDIPCASGRLLENRDLQVDPDIAGRYLGYGYGGGMHAVHQEGTSFGCGLHLMAVLPDGSCAKCAFFSRRPVGSVREGLSECWSRIRPVRLDSLECSCEFVSICRGGCRYRAELSGSMSGRDPYRCALYGILDPSD